MEASGSGSINEFNEDEEQTAAITTTENDIYTSIITAITTNTEFESACQNDTTDTEDNSSSPQSVPTFEKCVASLASLVDGMSICENILHDIKKCPAPVLDHHSTVLKIMDSVHYVKNALEDTLDCCSRFDEAVEKRNKTLSIDDRQGNTNQLVNHDPGLRVKLNTDNEREYLINLGPYQPIVNRFPSDGKNRFNSSWYREYNFLEYSIAKDSAFCFVCFLFPSGAGKEKAESAWSSEGVKGWGKMKSIGKNKKGKLDKHFSSDAHKCALSDYTHFLFKQNRINNLLDQNSRNNLIEQERIKNYNKGVIEILLDIARTLGRQGLAFRGPLDDQNGNFRQFVSLIARHNPVLKHWIENTKFRPYHVSYLSKDSQNDFIKLIGGEIREVMAREIAESNFFAVMADTTPDSSNKDVLSVIVRTATTDLRTRERLIDVVISQDKTGLGLATSIIQSLDNLKVDTRKKLCFQSYDFAASMSGQFNGAQRNISDIVGRSVPYVACQAHRTNTAIEHSCNVSTIVGDLFNRLEELYVFFTSSTKRSDLFKDEIAAIENSLQLKNLSKTRWTARAESIDAVNKSLEVIIDLLRKMSESDQLDPRTKTKAFGLYKNLMTFDFVVTLMFMKTILFKTKVLTKVLECQDLNIVDAVACIKSTVNSLNRIRTTEHEVEDLIEAAKILAIRLDIDPEKDFVKHHRRRVVPKRLDENRDTQVSFTINSFYKQQFFTVLDTLSELLSSNVQACIDTLKPIFDVFQFPLDRKNLKLEYISSLLQMYPNQHDVPSPDALQAELEILFDHCRTAEKFDDVLEQARKMNFLKLAYETLQFVITAACSVASNERAFSLLKFVKNEIRSTMGDDRLKDLLTIKCEVDIVDRIELKDSVRLWGELKKRRITV